LLDGRGLSLDNCAVLLEALTREALRLSRVQGGQRREEREAFQGDEGFKRGKASAGQVDERRRRRRKKGFKW